MPTLASLLLGLVLFASTSAVAAPLNLNSVHPDIASANVSVTFDANSDVLSAAGLAVQFADGVSVAPHPTISGGSFSLTASINDAGVASSASLSISGLVVGGLFDGTSGLLLTGTLADFGAGNSGDPLEFLFELTGGALAGAFGGIGAPIGTILNGTGASGSFAVSFDNLLAGPGTGTATADTFVPEPSSAMLVLFGCVGLSAFRRAPRIR